MDENLVGYLLDTLDAEERRQMESYLRAHANARKRLARLRQILQPLEADLQAVDPPPDLWVRTLAHVAAFQCRQLPAAPPVPAVSFASAPARGWWRRADVLVAASLLVCVGALLVQGVNVFRHRQYILACQNNLHNFWVSLQDYSEGHTGTFPNVAAADSLPRSRRVAGLVVPLLRDNGSLNDSVFVSCPANGRRLPLPHSLAELAAMTDDDFAGKAPALSGCYAYSLGYRDERGDVRGICVDPGVCASARVPIMADLPPNDVARGGLGNSPNHGGSGQNVLYCDGHCEFFKTRTVPVGASETDDIYVNFDNQVAPGKSRWDAVLGSSATHPWGPVGDREQDP
jgi:prepilin-type processing-associated H-X9-DG protein